MPSGLTAGTREKPAIVKNSTAALINVLIFIVNPPD
jgi:hypothetical protein